VMLCLRVSACAVLHTPRSSQGRGKCVHRNGPHHGRPRWVSDWRACGLAQQRAARLGRQPGDAGAPG